MNARRLGLIALAVGAIVALNLLVPRMVGALDLPDLPDVPDLPELPDWARWLLKWPKLAIFVLLIALAAIGEAQRRQKVERD